MNDACPDPDIAWDFIEIALALIAAEVVNLSIIFAGSPREPRAYTAGDFQSRAFIESVDLAPRRMKILPNAAESSVMVTFLI